MPPFDAVSMSALRICILAGTVPLLVEAALPVWWIRVPFVALYSILSFTFTFRIGRVHGQREAFIASKHLVEDLHAEALVSVYPAPVVWQDPDNRLH